MSVPRNMQEKYDEIAGLIEPVCDEYLNEEYKVLCLHALEKLCRKRPSPLLSGRPRTWAGGILHAVGHTNFLFDKSQNPHMKPSALAERIGLSQNTVSGKSREIRKMLKMNYFSAEWSLPSKRDENPLIWMVNVNGLPMDARYLPIELQQLCYEKGLIPYIPALREQETASSEDEDSEN